MWASRFNKKSGEFRSTSKVQQKHKELKWLMMNSDQHRRFNSKMIKDWPTSQTKAPGSRSMRNCFTLGQGRYRESEKFAEIWRKKTKIEIIEKFAEIWKDKVWNHCMVGNKSIVWYFRLIPQKVKTVYKMNLIFLLEAIAVFIKR